MGVDEPGQQAGTAEISYLRGRSDQIAVDSSAYGDDGVATYCHGIGGIGACGLKHCRVGEDEVGEHDGTFYDRSALVRAD
jgi:hypothetical protein